MYKIGKIKYVFYVYVIDWNGNFLLFAIFNAAAAARRRQTVFPQDWKHGDLEGSAQESGKQQDPTHDIQNNKFKF